MPDPAGLNKSGNYTTQSVKKLDRSIMNIQLIEKKILLLRKWFTKNQIEYFLNCILSNKCSPHFNIKTYIFLSDIVLDPGKEYTFYML